MHENQVSQAMVRRARALVGANREISHNIDDAHIVKQTAYDLAVKHGFTDAQAKLFAKTERFNMLMLSGFATAADEGTALAVGELGKQHLESVQLLTELVAAASAGSGRVGIGGWVQAAIAQRTLSPLLLPPAALPDGNPTINTVPPLPILDTGPLTPAMLTLGAAYGTLGFTLAPDPAYQGNSVNRGQVLISGPGGAGAPITLAGNEFQLFTLTYPAPMVGLPYIDVQVLNADYTTLSPSLQWAVVSAIGGGSLTAAVFQATILPTSAIARAATLRVRWRLNP